MNIIYWHMNMAQGGANLRTGANFPPMQIWHKTSLGQGIINKVDLCIVSSIYTLYIEKCFFL